MSEVSDARARARDVAEWVAVGDLLPWSGNPRKIDDDAVREAVGSLQRFGFQTPLLVWNGTLVAGHARRLAMLKILHDDPGLSSQVNAKLRSTLGPDLGVPVRVARFESIDEAHAYALRDNNPLGSWDMGAVQDIVDAWPESMIEGLGFDEGADKGQIGATESFDIEAPEFYLSVRGPMIVQPEAIFAIQEHLESLGNGVVVSVGLVRK